MAEPWVLRLKNLPELSAAEVGSAASLLRHDDQALRIFTGLDDAAAVAFVRGELRHTSGGLASTRGGTASMPKDERARAASKYMGYVLGPDGKPGAVTILDARHAVTYAHGSHAEWKTNGPPLNVYINNPSADKPRPVKAQVKVKADKMDFIVLQLDVDELDVPALDNDTRPGEPYMLLGYSNMSVVATGPQGEWIKPAPEGYASVSHGSIASSIPDKYGRVRGDTPCSPGDSGGGVFSLKTGKLIAINIGREKLMSERAEAKDGFKSMLVPVSVLLSHMAE